MSNRRYNLTVLLNVYDLHPCNGCLWYFGLGLFHCGVQLKYGDNINRRSKEYSYLGNALTESSGVFHCEPRHTFGAKLRTTLQMGTIQTSNRELSVILDRLRTLYLAKDYDILTKNCNHFCDEFVYELTSTHIASWLNRTASIASCCNCCIPQKFYDALVEIQTNYNPNHDNQGQQSPSSSNKYVSWIYSNSYLKGTKCKKKGKKILKNGSIRRCSVESQSEDHITNGEDNQDNDIAVDDYMNYKHSVTVIGLKHDDEKAKIVKIQPLTNANGNLGINPLNQHILLTNIPKLKNKNEHANNRLHIKKYKNSNGFKMRLSGPQNLNNVGNVASDTSVSATNSNNNSDNNNDNESVSETSTNWANASYQRLPKTPTSQQSIDSIAI